MTGRLLGLIHSGRMGLRRTPESRAQGRTLVALGPSRWVGAAGEPPSRPPQPSALHFTSDCALATTASTNAIVRTPSSTPGYHIAGDALRIAPAKPR